MQPLNPVLPPSLLQPTSARNQFIQRMYAAALQSVRDTRTAAGGLRVGVAPAGMGPCPCARCF